MQPRELKKLADLLGRDLAGWMITQCHFLELDHGLMGSFPAITQDNEVVLTLDKPSLQKVWERLERRPAKLSSFMVVVHPESGVAFNLETYVKEDFEQLRVLSGETIEALCREESPFRWAPGLLPLTERLVRDPVFA